MCLLIPGTMSDDVVTTKNFVKLSHIGVFLQRIIMKKPLAPAYKATVELEQLHNYLSCK